jgi:hypothetical protein
MSAAVAGTTTPSFRPGRTYTTLWDVTGAATLLNGDAYSQHAVHLITLRWGKIHELDVFEDSQEVAGALAVQAAAGLDEAVAEQIVS